MIGQINTVVFSKNRACQLELLLRSLKMPATVLYTYDQGFEKGYKRVRKMYPEFNFIKERNFKKDLVRLIKNSKYVLFLTDDDLMIEDVDENSSEFSEFKNNDEILTLSLGLMPTPDDVSTIWRWSKYRGIYKYRLWGYPMSVDSCIFRVSDILPIIKNNEIKNLNFLETVLNENIPKKPYMMCFEKRKLINNSINQVQSDFPAHTSGPFPEELEKRFLSGERISLKDILEKSKNAKYYRIKENYKYE